MQITLSAPMTLALEHLAERHGVPVATEATMILRQALARTMESKEVLEKIAQYNMDRGVRSWREDRQLEHEVEMRYATIKEALPPLG
jgi:hypothetical protein